MSTSISTSFISSNIVHSHCLISQIKTSYKIHVHPLYHHIPISSSSIHRLMTDILILLSTHPLTLVNQTTPLNTMPFNCGQQQSQQQWHPSLYSVFQKHFQYTLQHHQSLNPYRIALPSLAIPASVLVE